MLTSWWPTPCSQIGRLKGGVVYVAGVPSFETVPGVRMGMRSVTIAPRSTSFQIICRSAVQVPGHFVLPRNRTSPSGTGHGCHVFNRWLTTATSESHTIPDPCRREHSDEHTQRQHCPCSAKFMLPAQNGSRSPSSAQWPTSSRAAKQNELEQR